MIRRVVAAAALVALALTGAVATSAAADSSDPTNSAAQSVKAGRTWV